MRVHVRLALIIALLVLFGTCLLNGGANFSDSLAMGVMIYALVWELGDRKS